MGCAPVLIINASLSCKGNIIASDEEGISLAHETCAVMMQAFCLPVNQLPSHSKYVVQFHLRRCEHEPPVGSRGGLLLLDSGDIPTLIQCLYEQGEAALDVVHLCRDLRGWVGKGKDKGTKKVLIFAKFKSKLKCL